MVIRNDCRYVLNRLREKKKARRKPIRKHGKTLEQDTRRTADGRCDVINGISSGYDRTETYCVLLVINQNSRGRKRDTTTGFHGVKVVKYKKRDWVEPWTLSCMKRVEFYCRSWQTMQSLERRLAFSGWRPLGAACSARSTTAR